MILINLVIPRVLCVCLCVFVPSLSGELEAELLACDCTGVLFSSTDGDRDGLSQTLSCKNSLYVSAIMMMTTK